ncbi:methyltransferase [Streptomyces sp. YGL11-2]|uniref:methyltransferase n=1 Tax=Streptomyces sp. YGL11-2 TaxID=3414028 RepID=UPI003CF5E191
MGVTIGIIGGGTAGACVINALAEHPPDLSGAESGEVLVFDDTALWWRGRAYQDDGEYVWCNVPMSDMSVRYHDPDHGLAWMRARDLAVDDPVTGQPALLTRPAYGDYLNAATSEAISRLGGRGWRVRLVSERAARLWCDRRGVRLETTGGRCHDLDRAVLAVGGNAYADPYRLSGTADYLPDPYPLEKRLAGLDRGCRVGILGTGLAAVDVTVALQELGHDGPISMFCRSGLLPAVRGPHRSHQLTHLTVPAIERAAHDGPLSLAALRRLVEAELRSAGSSLDHLRRMLLPQPPLTRLSAELDAFRTGNDIGPQVLQKAVPTVGQDLWYLLAQDAKHWILDRLHRYVMALCCPMPLVNATRIAHLLSSGRLTVHPGTTGVQPAPLRGFTIDTSAGPVRVDLLVNTVTPARRTIPHLARGLIDHATATGVLGRHPLGGLHLDRHTSLALTPHGRPQPRLHLLGELTGTAFYFISGMPVLAKRSADIAHCLSRGNTPTAPRRSRRVGPPNRRPAPWRAAADRIHDPKTTDREISMSNETTAVDKGSEALTLLEQAMEYAYPAALRAAAVTGVADHLADGPKTPEELGRMTGADAQKLYRTLRLLATRGVFREDEQGRFELTSTAEYLRSDVPLSVRAAIMMITSKAMWLSTGELAGTLRGDSDISFERLFGKTIWEHWGRDLPPEEEFHTGMMSMTEPEIQSPVHSYDFPEGATVVDVGGGYGGLLLPVLRANPTLRGVLYDREHVLAKHRLAELGADNRWEAVPGDFFETCPEGDVYLLKYITHDWDDERAALILRNCRQAMKPGGRVLLFDMVIPPGNSPHPGKLMDFIVMAIYPGRERTEEDFRQLLAKAGLRLTRINNTAGYLSTIEAVAA